MPTSGSSSACDTLCCIAVSRWRRPTCEWHRRSSVTVRASPARLPWLGTSSLAAPLSMPSWLDVTRLPIDARPFAKHPADNELGHWWRGVHWVGPVGEVEHTDDQLHGVIGSLPNRHRANVVDEEVDSSRLPIHGVAMKLADVQRIRVGGEFLGKSRVAEPMNATTQGHHREGARPTHDTVPEDLNQADLTAALGLVLQADHPRREHRPWTESDPAGHLDVSVVRCEAPLRGMGLGDDQAWPERLLAAGAAHRSGPIAALDRRYPQWAVVQVRAPQRLIWRDRKTQTLGIDGVRRSRRLHRTPRRKVGRRPDRLVQAVAETLVDFGWACFWG